jgi:hypothetical protein
MYVHTIKGVSYGVNMNVDKEKIRRRADKLGDNIKGFVGISASLQDFSSSLRGLTFVPTHIYIRTFSNRMFFTLVKNLN